MVSLSKITRHISKPQNDNISDWTLDMISRGETNMLCMFFLVKIHPFG